LRDRRIYFPSRFTFATAAIAPEKMQAPSYIITIIALNNKYREYVIILIYHTF